MSKRTVFVLGLLILVVALFVIRGGKNGSAQTSSSGSSGQCTVQITADLLNVRASPDGNSAVVQKLASGTTLTASKTVQGGYRELSANHWAATQFLKTVSGDC